MAKLTLDDIAGMMAGPRSPSEIAAQTIQPVTVQQEYRDAQNPHYKPNRFESALGSVGNWMRGTMSPVDSNGLPNANPVGTPAMIPTAANLERFNALKQAAKESFLKNYPNAAEKVAETFGYMKARYPKHMAAPTEVAPSRSLTAESMRGEYMPHINTVYFKPDAIGSDMVSTLGHETTHAVDAARKGKDFLYEGRPDASTIQSMIDSGRGAEAERMYRAIPSEARAYKAGGTAVDGYQKYLDLFADKLFGR